MRSPFRRRPKKLKVDKYALRWKSLQKHCANKATWTQAIVEADDLLAETLKKLKYKGKSTGERLVAAQHDLSDNEKVWYGHKLRNKLDTDATLKLKKTDVMDALTGFRQALRDLGALEPQTKDKK